MANKNNYTAGEYFLLLVVTGLFIGYIYTANSILNYPEYLHYYGIGFSFFLVLLIDIKPAIKRCAPLKRWYEQYYAVGLTLMSWVLISIITGTIILIPFNYYDKSQSKNSSSETFDCKIQGIGSRPGQHNVYFLFNGKTNSFICQDNQVKDIYYKKNYGDYKFEITVKKALLGSYILEDWRVIPNNPQ